ncbi:unnamed protein product, partial [Heterotrigona itama]
NFTLSILPSSTFTLYSRHCFGLQAIDDGWESARYLLDTKRLTVTFMFKTPLMYDTYLSDPSNLYVLLGSLISCVTSPFLKLLPCMPCLWNANTLSGKQTEGRKMI